MYASYARIFIKLNLSLEFDGVISYLKYRDIAIILAKNDVSIIEFAHGVSIILLC